MEDSKAHVLKMKCEYPDCVNQAEVMGRIAKWVFESKGGVDARIVLWSKVINDDQMFTCAGHAHVLDSGGTKFDPVVNRSVRIQQLILFD